jgi:anti-sigma regulatory factor (Ser/Thr protein kinase)
VLLAFAAQHRVLGAPASNGHDVVPIRRAASRRRTAEAADSGAGRCDGTRAAARRPSAAQRPAQAWIIGEPIWPGRTPTEYPACVQHEAMINVALAEAAATILCPYDASRLHPAVLADAERTHPVLVRRERKQPSALYADPAAVVDLFNRPFPDPPPAATSMVFDANSLPQLRALVAEQAEAASMGQDRIAAFQLAANEVASNVLQHTAGPGTMRLWQDNGRLVCEIRDSGHLSDRLAGRRLVASEANSEHGLVLVHSLCDLVQTYTHLSGTTFRLHMQTG